jgi:hypothetical protein
MRLPVRISAILLMLMLTAIPFSSAIAADSDPTSLVGQWVGSQKATNDPRGVVTGMFYLTINTVENDGTYQGTYYYACGSGCSPKIANHDQPITGKIVRDGDKMNVSFHYDAGGGFFYKFQAQASGDVMTGTTEGRLGAGEITLIRKK